MLRPDGAAVGQRPGLIANPRPSGWNLVEADRAQALGHQRQQGGGGGGLGQGGGR